eukprot:261239_1
MSSKHPLDLPDLVYEAVCLAASSENLPSYDGKHIQLNSENVHKVILAHKSVIYHGKHPKRKRISYPIQSNVIGVDGTSRPVKNKRRKIHGNVRLSPSKMRITHAQVSDVGSSNDVFVDAPIYIAVTKQLSDTSTPSSTDIYSRITSPPSNFRFIPSPLPPLLPHPTPMLSPEMLLPSGMSLHLPFSSEEDNTSFKYLPTRSSPAMSPLTPIGTLCASSLELPSSSIVKEFVLPETRTYPIDQRFSRSLQSIEVTHRPEHKKSVILNTLKSTSDYIL